MFHRLLGNQPKIRMNLRNWFMFLRNTNSTAGVVLFFRQAQNDHHLANEIFKLISENENVWIWIITSLKFVFKVSIYNNPTYGYAPTWRQAMIWTNDGLL